MRIVALCLIPVEFAATMPVTVLGEPAPAKAGRARAVSVQPALSSETAISRRKADDIEPMKQPSQFSAQPSDEEIYRAHVLDEQLAPAGGESSPQENRLLANALLTYRQRGDGGDVSPIERFLESHRASPWRAALLTNMGIVYRRTGRFSKALDAWEEAWALAKDESNPRAHAVADRAIGELSQINAWFGRYERLQPLLSEIEGRQLFGNAAEMVKNSRDGLWMMHHKPEISFKCGPYALERIRSYSNIHDELDKKIHEARSTLSGMSLEQVWLLAKELGMDHQMAKRRPGVSVIVPSVVNWKVGHYAAIVAEHNGRYLVQDPTAAQGYTGDIWIDQKTLDAETTGYFLVPSGELPRGWERVTAEEGRTIWGRGYTTAVCTTCFGCEHGGLGGDDGTCKDCGGPPPPMATYSISPLLVSLTISDTPVRYSPPIGPSVRFKVTYNQRDGLQDGYQYSNLGHYWTFNWSSYIKLHDDPNDLSSAPTISHLYVPSGGGEIYSTFNQTTKTFAPERTSGANLMRMSSNTYVRTVSDGTSFVYGRPDNTNCISNCDRKIFLTSIVDPAGNALTLSYDEPFISSPRLRYVVDALGQTNTLHYNATNDALVVTSVVDPFGRSATLQYENLGTTNAPVYRLKSVTDMIGLTSQFAYSASDSNFVEKLITPYGTNIFTKTDTTDQNLYLGGEEGVAKTFWHALETTDPLGGRERVEYGQRALQDTEAVNPTGMPFLGTGELTDADTIYWDKQAMATAPGDFTAARVLHWMRDYPSANAASGTLSSEKKPLEARVFYVYSGQTTLGYLNGVAYARPSKSGRVLDNGTTQLYQNVYSNRFGKVTKAIDPVGRATVYVYETNDVDLLEIKQQEVSGMSTNLATLAKYTYNSKHKPLTAVDASGQTNTFGYNAQGQLVTNVNAKDETTIMVYSNNYLTAVIGPTGATSATYTYDGYGRVRTTTDSEGYAVTTDYDNLDRVTQNTYPDGTSEQTVYEKLDAVERTDRIGRTTSTEYDALRRLTSTTDMLGHVTQYNWCNCGSLESIVDPLGHTTSWHHDVQGRVTEKVCDDGSKMRYLYEDTTSRPKRMIDAQGQYTDYNYNTDNTLQQVSYPNGIVATPTVTYTYGTNYNRLVSMVDGAGTTTYNYFPITSPPTLGAGRLGTIDAPLSNDAVTYAYDELGRVLSQAIGTATNSVTYDLLGRVKTATNPLGTFTNSYVGVTRRASSITYPNGQIVTNSYFDNAGDHRLKEIWNQGTNGTTLSKFDYTYNAVGEIKTWKQQAGMISTNAFDFEYDADGRLLGGLLQDANSSAIVKRYVYGYSKSDNRTSEQIDDAVTASTHNNLNQLVSQQTGGPFRFNGSVNETSTVSVAGQIASITWTNIPGSNTLFRGSASVSGGTNIITVTAQDYSGNSTNNRYRVVVGAGADRAFTYDLNGNLVTMSNGTTVVSNVWDAANRLVKIYSNGTYRSEFTYDGKGRRVRQTEISGTMTNSDRRMLWCGTEICDERDSTGGTVTKRFFFLGEQIGGTNYFFARDHLGSVRGMTDNTGATRAQYEYDPWGRRIKISGDLEADFGFTGHYIHSYSGFSLTLYRAYAATLGQWLSPDPLYRTIYPDVRGDVNLYSYVDDDPIRYVDTQGLKLTEFKIYGNYCGGGWCGGKMLNGAICNYKVAATTSLDECCKQHDKCDDWCTLGKDTKDNCNKQLCKCLKGVNLDDSEFLSGDIPPEKVSIVKNEMEVAFQCYSKNKPD